MNKIHTYRLFFACFLAGLVCMVFVMQGLHHIVDHHHHEIEACSFEGEHIHDEGHQHFSCSICFFHFEPTDLDRYILALSSPNIISTKLLFDDTQYHYFQKLRQSHLRGPPSFLG